MRATAYLEAAGWAQDFAHINRQVMMENVITAVGKVRGLPNFKADLLEVDCHHNYVTQEEHLGEKLLITRKGAVRAGLGELGIIPGSMGAKSFIVRGLGNEESFCSCSHGAGRVMSHTKAKKTFTIDEQLPLGAIVFWANPLSTVPSDWKVCDGTSGMPDLTDRFALSVRSWEDPGQKLGAHSAFMVLPDHSHTFETDPVGSHHHFYSEDNRDTENGYYGGLVPTHVNDSFAVDYPDTEDAGAHTHAGVLGVTGGLEYFDNRPAYAELAYIIRTGAASGAQTPVGAITIWTGTRASIPPGWSPCDGVDGRPDMRDRFILGAPNGVDPGGFGGEQQVTLTASNLPQHSHTPTFDSAGVHDHGYRDDYGASNYTGFGGPTYSRYAYDQTTSSTKTTDPAGTHSHSGTTDSTGGSMPFDNRPAYYRVIYIVKE
jgi:microcystin-dependent protein